MVSLGKFQNWFNVSTKEIALISVLASVWITSQTYLGPIISQTFHVHGVIQRFVGWLLMLVLAELTGKFGRVSIMATVAALATRMIRRRASLYIWMVGLGYVLGGLTFDLLFFIRLANNFEGRDRKGYLLTISVISGALALVPYLLYRLFISLLSSSTFQVGMYTFIAWILIPLPEGGAYFMVKGILLSFLGVFTRLPVLPRIKVWSPRKGVQGRRVLVR